uniref:Ig-like domain-containing protein n=1 Tax=Poecilia formosa TaxID=48698 RepID=A0A096LUY2_POEFO
ISLRIRSICSKVLQKLYKWVRGQNGWSVTYSSSQICTIKGSTVDLKCNYTHPDTVGDTVIEVRKLIWYTKGDNYAPVDLKDDQDYAGRIKYKHGCTVAIRDVRESDSAVYKFRFITNHQNGKYTGSPGVTLSVSAVELQVIKWERKQSGTRAEMTCKSKCLSDLHPYIWVKNGQDVLTQTSSSFSYMFSDADRISCAAAGHRNFPSPSVCQFVFSIPDMPNLPSVSSSSGHIVKGDPINLTCSSDANPAATYTWYKKDTSGPLSKGSQLVFKSIQSSDSGEYYCKAQNVLRIKASKVVFIDVKYAPKLPRISVSASEIMEGISLTLSCSSDSNPAANYTWFKENEKTPQSSGQNLTITNIGRQHSGLYFCEAHNSRGSHKSAIHLTVAATMLMVRFCLHFVFIFLFSIKILLCLI